MQIYDDAGQAHVARGYVVMDRNIGRNACQDLVIPATDYAVMGPSHTYIGYKGGTVGQELLVGSGDMGVRADNRSYLAIQIAAWFSIARTMCCKSFSTLLIPIASMAVSKPIHVF